MIPWCLVDSLMTVFRVFWLGSKIHGLYIVYTLYTQKINLLDSCSYDLTTKAWLAFETHYVYILWQTNHLDHVFDNDCICSFLILWMSQFSLIIIEYHHPQLIITLNYHYHYHYQYHIISQLLADCFCSIWTLLDRAFIASLLEHNCARRSVKPSAFTASGRGGRTWGETWSQRRCCLGWKNCNEALPK